MKWIWKFLLTGCLVSVSIAWGETWTAFPMSWNQSPVDLSFLLDPPAGKHGFLGIKNERFVFEDGVSIRFWGTTLTGSGCFPSQQMAPAIAERLYQFGINLVRFHQLDAEWADPNLFTNDPGTFLNPETLDRLDYLLYQLENRGIYVWLDGLSNRRVSEQDNVPSWNYLPPGLKGYVYFDPGLQHLHQSYLSALWSHRNRYTGRQYRDSPSIAMTELFHDNNLFLDRPRIEPYAGLFNQQWKDWQASQGIKPPKEFNWRSPTAEMQRYLSDTMGRSMAFFSNFLRGFSVKIPVTSTNSITALRDIRPAVFLDFVHSEGLWNPPPISEGGFTSRRMTDVSPGKLNHLFAQLSFPRIDSKPFLVSKWGEPWPSFYRAELPVWMAAMACFQDWQGCISSNYCSKHDPEVQSIIAPLEAFNDPCFWGLMPAAALLFQRQDVHPARKEVFMAVPESQMFTAEPVTPLSCMTTRLTDWMRVSVRLRANPSGSSIFSPTQPEDFIPYVKNADQNAMLRRDVERGIVFIDSPRTQAMIGRLSEARLGELSALDVETGEDFAVVCASSLEYQAIDQSRSIWLTVVSQARNHEFQFSASGPNADRIDNPGIAPVEIRETPVRLFLKTNYSDWTIEAVDGNGQVTTRLPYQVERGRLSFRAGVHGTIFYRLSCK